MEQQQHVPQQLRHVAVTVAGQHHFAAPQQLGEQGDDCGGQRLDVRRDRLYNTYLIIIICYNRYLILKDYMYKAERSI